MIERRAQGRRAVTKNATAGDKKAAAAASALTTERARAREGSADGSKRPDVSLFPANAAYDPGCTRCPRLASFLTEAHAKYPSYWCRPVPSFGDPAPRVVLIGLAPGMHGANRSARPFTGDYAGILLYETLFELGIASQPQSLTYDDPLKLTGFRIVNSVKCVPPENKPTPDEIRRCNDFLKAELATLKSARVYVALGRVAHDAILTALGRKRSQFTFGHAAEHALDGTHHLVDSYHCSRYNTQTRRLTAQMFRAVLKRACDLAES